MGNRFGFIGMEPGVTARHMWVLLYAAFVSIGLATFDAFGTPYVLSENVGVPIQEQGGVVGRRADLSGAARRARGVGIFFGGLGGLYAAGA